MRIIYTHDDTETLKDAVTLQLTDGVHTVQARAQVTVLPVNDEEPRLLRNARLEVEPGQRRVISSAVLQAEDLDTPPNLVFYILNTEPGFGNLLLKTQTGWMALSSAQNFTQDDVDLNRLWYQHAAPAARGFKGQDSFSFSLSDLDNETPAQSFFISINRPPKGDLVLLSRAVHLVEGQQVILNTDVLMAADAASRPEELLYTVTAPPQHGLIHAVQHPGVPLRSFTQLHVAAQRVCYTHDNSYHGNRDSFSFVVTNGETSRVGAVLSLSNTATVSFPPSNTTLGSAYQTGPRRPSPLTTCS
eukprot:XP_011616995.1 PREDICTED: FRAS1-related extracellular matrix protein 1-like [Takifugu rubripes]